MSVPAGIDFGNGQAILGIARNRGIDIVTNEVSARATPSLVGFGPKSRYLGETAKSQETSNIKNTVGSLKRFVGRKFTDPIVQKEKDRCAFEVVDVNGEAGARVRYLGKQHEFSFTQLTAMYFGKLRHTLLNETEGNVNDVVITVPVYFGDSQRRAVASAAVIAGLNPVRIVNDSTAAAVGYGVFRAGELPEDKPRIVAIVDIGHSDYTVSIIGFKKGEGKVLGSAYNENFGGRTIDAAITDHFAKIFADKYKIDIYSNAKARNRVMAQAERVKKILSANTSAQFNVESLMNDIDVSSTMTREELEEYLAPHIEALDEPIQKALRQANLTKEQVDVVELIGGCTRVPSIKERLRQAFGGKALSTTMNQDEVVATGATFLCAAHSPTVRVRPFKFEDRNLHSITFKWDKFEDEELSELEVFPSGASYPCTKLVTLFRKSDFSLEAYYTNQSDIPAGFDAYLGKWTIKNVRPSSNGEAVAVKIKLRQDPSGLAIVESAYTAEEVTTEEPIEEEAASSETPEGASEDAEPAAPKTRTVKKWVKRDELEIEFVGTGLTPKEIDNMTEQEAQYASSDKLVADTEDRKNTLEEYIYDVRGKLDGLYSEFANESEKKRLLEMADAAEEWLYGDGEDASKGQYIAKYEELASIGNLIKGRYQSKLEEERQAQVAAREAEQQRKMAEKMAAEKAAREAAAAETKDVEMEDTVE